MNGAKLAAIAVLTAIPTATANDTAATLGAGGLVPVKSSAIVMESEDLQISVHEINVNYVFRNTTRRDLNVVVAFPLPEIDGDAVANIPIAIPASDPLNFIGFEVFAAGKKIEPQVEVRSFFNGPEITNELRSFHLPLSALDGNVAAAIKRLSAEDRLRVERKQWVDCSLTKDGKCWPYWQSRIQFYWTQHFKAGSTVEVRHRYHPVVGGGAMYGGDSVSGDEDYFARYCPSAEAVDRINTKLARAERDGAHPVLRQREIEYILTTANNWRGPIRRFHLSVLSDSPEDIVATCMPELKRVAPARYELQRRDFRPERELDLLVLQALR